MHALALFALLGCQRLNVVIAGLAITFSKSLKLFVELKVKPVVSDVVQVVVKVADVMEQLYDERMAAQLGGFVFQFVFAKGFTETPVGHQFWSGQEAWRQNGLIDLHLGFDERLVVQAVDLVERLGARFVWIDEIVVNHEDQRVGTVFFELFREF